MSKNLLAGIIGLIILLGIGGGYYYFQNQPKQNARVNNRMNNAKTFAHPVGKLKDDCKKPEICSNIDQDLDSFKKQFPVDENNRIRGQNRGGTGGGQNLTTQEQDQRDQRNKARRPFLDKFEAFCRQAHPEFSDNKKFNANGSINRNNPAEFTCRFWEN
jgi:hypothetical protein